MLNKTQLAIREMVRDFAQREIKPHTAAFKAAQGYPPCSSNDLRNLA